LNCVLLEKFSGIFKVQQCIHIIKTNGRFFSLRRLLFSEFQYFFCLAPEAQTVFQNGMSVADNKVGKR